MIKKLFHIILTGLLVTTGCVMSLLSAAQNNDTNNIQQQFISYQSNNYNEKIFVHTDKTFYVTGESIWFKVYCVDEQLHRPSVVSKIAYVEIISKENKPLMQAKIAMNNGSGNGSFIIPSFITSGNYILRAYTKWMTNFDADYFFQTSLTIFNNLKPGIVTQPAKQKNFSVSFFPEGGNLVEGLASDIAFKAVDENGEPVNCSGTITDTHNKQITDFTSLKFGMGKFSFAPAAGEIYKAIIKIADTTFEAALPTVYKQGYVMHLDEQDSSHIKIILQSNVPDDKVAYMLVHAQNLFKDFQQIKLTGGKAIFNIDKNKLQDGISVITIFNAAKQPVCERLYFKNPVEKLNIRIKPDADNYQTKKQVNITLDVSNNLRMNTSADMSVSVFMVDSLQSAIYTDIVSYLLLTSELKGKIVSPEYYFQNNNDASAAADNLMLTQGWRRFKWEDILQNKKPYFEFIPEAEGLIINGKIIRKDNQLPAKNINATLSVASENFQLSNAYSNDSGIINFNTRNFYGSNNLVIKTDSNYTFNPASSFSTRFSPVTNNVYKPPAALKQLLLFRSINVQADNAYLVNEKQHSYLYNAEDTSLFFGKPDKRYNLDDYTRYTTMEEVLREYVTEVRVRKENQQYHLKVIDLPTKTFSENDPLILLDGTPVPDVKTMMELDPLKLKRIDVAGRKYYYGNTESDGIISLITYTGNLADYSLNAGSVTLNFDGLQREREFYSPVYDTGMNTYIPDLRNVLFWSPSLKTNANGKVNFSFYTSEITGKFACVVQGISSDGLPGSNMIMFDVAK